MKLMPCPLNGLRSIAEFHCAGPVEERVDPATLDDTGWADRLALSENPAGLVREWWLHMPTGYWFIAERDTLSDTIVRTYTARALFPDRFDFDGPAAGRGRA